jgi:hypothetical protein
VWYPYSSTNVPTELSQATYKHTKKEESLWKYLSNITIDFYFNFNRERKYFGKRVSMYSKKVYFNILYSYCLINQSSIIYIYWELSTTFPITLHFGFCYFIFILTLLGRYQYQTLIAVYGSEPSICYSSYIAVK